MAKRKKAKGPEPIDNRDRIEPDLLHIARPIDSFLLDSHQSNLHDRRSIEEIKTSLVESGQCKPIFVKRSTMEVKAGNGTLQAAKELGWTYIAAVLSDKPEEAARLYAIRDNRTHQFSEFDVDALVSEVTDLGVSPDTIGWAPDEWEGVIADQMVSGFEFDELPPVPDDDAEPSDDRRKEGVTVKLAFHPAVWLANREELTSLFERLERNYNAKSKIDE